MKRLAIILISVLVIVYLGLSMIDRESEYKAERLLFMTMKRYSAITSNPDVVPPKLLSSVERSLQKLTEKYPNTRSAKKGYFKLNELYIADKQYDKALALADQMLERYPEDIAMASNAHFTKAIAYQMSEDWESALGEFTILRERYDNTAIGLSVPMHIVRYYRSQGEGDKAESVLREAIQFYDNLRKSFRATALGYVASNFLVQTYMALEQYEDAGRVVQGMLVEYPTDSTLMQNIPYIELIYVQALGQPNRAVNIFRTVLSRVENPRVKGYIEEKIRSIELDPKED